MTLVFNALDSEYGLIVFYAIPLIVVVFAVGVVFGIAKLHEWLVSIHENCSNK